jgi:hypothetical protein
MTNKEQRRLQLINDMCLTFRHDYGITINEDDRMYTLNSGMTELERKGFFDTMTQVFDHHIEPILKERDELIGGDMITLPKSEQHAKAMILLAENYLNNR